MPKSQQDGALRPRNEAGAKFSIRPYDPADFEILYRIDQQCYRPGIAYSRRTLREFLAMDGARCLVACQGREILGFLISVHEGAHGHLVTIDIVDAARRRGVGTALVDRAEKELTARGVRQVALEVAMENEPALAFWSKLGYRRIAVYPRYYLNRIDAYVMTKLLLPRP